jgi:hypothetical protein
MLIRDELAAEQMMSETLTPSGLAFYPPYQRTLALWATHLMRAGTPERIIETLNQLQNNSEDLYGARWSAMAGIVTACLPFGNKRIEQFRHAVEESLVMMWNKTSSNRMKAQIVDNLQAIRSELVLLRPGEDDLEQIWPDLDIATPELDLPAVLIATGQNGPAQQALREGTKDNRAITLALVEALTFGDEEIARAVACHLVQRNIEQQTVMDFWNKAAPIDRLVELAVRHSTTQHAAAYDLQRAKIAQAAALTVLSQPAILTNPTLLKRIPESVIHTLMAGFHMLVLMKDNKPLVITADGRAWNAQATVRGVSPANPRRGRLLLTLSEGQPVCVLQASGTITYPRQVALLPGSSEPRRPVASAGSPADRPTLDWRR